MSQLDIFSKDILADTIVNYWERLSSERTVWMNRMQRVREYLNAPDTAYTENSNLPWKNKTVIPKLTQIYDNLLAQYMQTIIPDDNWVAFEEDYPTADQSTDSKTEQYIRQKIEDSNTRETIRELLSDYIFPGMACVGVEHVHNKVKSLVDGEDTTKYKGSKIFRVDYRDFVIEPKANNYEESIFIRRREVPISNLIKHNDTNPLIKYDENAINKAVELRNYIRTTEDALKNSSLRVDGFSSAEDYFNSGRVELLEFWGDIYDEETGELLENQTIAVIDRMYVLYNVSNPIWNGMRPYVVTGWRARPGNLYAQSPLEQLVGIQYRIDHLENLKADIMDLIAYPMTVIYGTPTEDFQFEPGGVFYAGNEGRVDVLAPQANALQADTYIMTYMNLMEEMAGAPKMTAGHRTPGEKTKFEVSVLEQGANKMYLEKVTHFEDTLIEPMLNLFYVILAMNFDSEDIIRYFDDDVEALEVIKVNKEDVIRDGRVKPIGSKNYRQKQKDLSEISQAMQILSSTDLTSAHVDGYAISKAIEQKLDFEKYEFIKRFKGITDRVDAQAAAQRHTQEASETLGGQVNGNSPDQQGT